MTEGFEEKPTATIEGMSCNLPVGGRKMHLVLVIDDSPEIRIVIDETLNLFGCRTILADDGVNGIRMAREHLPDLIICDVNMPNLDGYGTLKALREDDATTMIPFMFLSGAADRVTIRKGMELGADDYLTKPFSPKELMAAVTTRLEKQAELRRHSDRKLDELRGNLTMSLPHELRTPLSGIIGLAHLMMEDHAEMPPAEVLESSRFIHESAMRLHRLIENFLVYSQIELMGSAAKGIEISEDIRPVLLQELVPPLARKVSARHKREGDLLLKIESVSALVPAENLAKIVEELTDNAFKFSEPGKPVLVSCEVRDGRFVFTAADKGRGMSAEQIARIAPHTQFDRHMYEQQGSGLGLFIAKRITELFGGGFAIESKLGEGMCVRVSFAAPGI